MKINLSITAFLGFLAVLLGAFGAHILKEKLGVNKLKIFETGVRYQMYHVIVLLFINTYNGLNSKTKNIISTLFFIGILFFSGSLYLLTTSNVNSKILGPITPLGGLFLMLGWVLLLFNFIKKK